MIIHKVIFAGLVASFSLAHANPVVLKNAEPDAIESVANIVKPIGKELVGLTSLPDKPVTVAANNSVPAADGLARAPAVTSAGMVRTLNIEVDAPAPAATVTTTAVPIQENDINMFLLLALLVGAILLRRRAE